MAISKERMLSPEKAVEHSIDIDGDPRVVPVYADADSTEVLYYVLERGHDYSIQEPTVKAMRLLPFLTT